MPEQQHLSVLRTAAVLSVFAPLIDASIGFDCSNVVRQGVTWNLKDLGGPRAVHWLRAGEPSSHNFTFTLDICKPLGRHKGVPPQDECAAHTRICGIDRSHNPYENVTTVDTVVNIAGDYFLKNGLHLESEVTRLKGSGSNADSEKDGLRVEMFGGKSPLEKSGTKQKAIIEFLCDKTRDGTDTEMPVPGDEDDSDDEKDSGLARREDNGNDEKQPTSALQFISYKKEKLKDEEWGVLRLEWHSSHACEDALQNQPTKPSGSWGFFTWFIIILFLAVATYLIFGSWLNYNRYGARGWDLVPHGDAIRDIPYIMKDFGRKVATTVQGPGTRGGYSAV